MLETLLLVLTAICTHLGISCGQTLLHHCFGHRRLGGLLYRNHIKLTLVLHVRGDQRVALSLASRLPPGQNHALQEGEPAREQMFEEIDHFLAKPKWEAANKSPDAIAV